MTCEDQGSSLLNLVGMLQRWLSGKESACQCKRLRFDPRVRKIPPEKGLAPQSSILAWEIPWTEAAGGLQSLDCEELDTT